MQCVMNLVFMLYVASKIKKEVFMTGVTSEESDVLA